MVIWEVDYMKYVDTRSWLPANNNYKLKLQNAIVLNVCVIVTQQ